MQAVLFVFSEEMINIYAEHIYIYLPNNGFVNNQDLVLTKQKEDVQITFTF